MWLEVSMKKTFFCMFGSKEVMDYVSRQCSGFQIIFRQSSNPSRCQAPTQVPRQAFSSVPLREAVKNVLEDFVR